MTIFMTNNLTKEWAMRTTRQGLQSSVHFLIGSSVISKVVGPRLKTRKKQHHTSPYYVYRRVTSYIDMIHMAMACYGNSIFRILSGIAGANKIMFNRIERTVPY